MAFRIAASVLTVCSVLAWADDPKPEAIDPAGKPKEYKAGQSSRYVVWHDSDGWHFRYTTGSDDVIAFVGSIEVVGGRFSTITPRGTPSKNVKTGADAVPMKSTAPKYTINSKINRGIESGIDFTLDDKATGLKFDLKINGKDVPGQVYIGTKGEHPKSAPFLLPAKPKD